MKLSNGTKKWIFKQKLFCIFVVLFYQKLVIYIFESSLFFVFFLTAMWLSHDQLWGTFEEAALLTQ